MDTYTPPIEPAIEVAENQEVAAPSAVTPELTAEAAEIIKTSTFYNLVCGYTKYYTKHVAETKAEAKEHVSKLVSAMLDHGDITSAVYSKIDEVIEASPINYNDTIKNRNRKIRCGIYDMLATTTFTNAMTDKLDETHGAILMNYVSAAQAYHNACVELKAKFDKPINEAIAAFINSYGAFMDSGFIAALEFNG